MAGYEATEGIDYIVDLYAVTGVDPESSADEARKAINKKLSEYHPDRLEGLAPEFRSKGERMAILLNRAKIVLLDEARKAEYDDILSSWEGPLSSDGTPIIRITDALRADAARKTSEELEATFQSLSLEVTKMVKYDPKQQALLARTLEQEGDGEDAADLREAYDAALFAEDQVLAIEEAERGQLLGLTINPRYELTEEYSSSVQAALEVARSEQVAEQERRALGGASRRLELLAGTSQPEKNSELQPIATGSLPAYYEDQAKKVTELAAKREALLEKRLELFQPNYPIVELQTEAQPYIALGIENKDGHMWLAFVFDPKTLSMDAINLDETVADNLRDEEYGKVYDAGYNIITFAPKEQIDLTTMLNTALSKYVNKYYPKLNED